MKRIFTLLGLFSIILLTGLRTSAQTIYRSINSGNWNAASNVWEISTDNGSTWNPTTATPTSNQSVIINNGHEISLNAATRNILNVTINAGGRLYAGAANAIRIGTGSSGSTNIVGVLTNNGTLGGPGELMPIELASTATSITITGNGTAEVGRIRPSGANGNTSAVIILDQNMKLNTQGNYILSALNGGAVTENNTLTVNAGKTITAATGTGYFHSGGNSAATGGSYTYNINGTVDMSAASGNLSLSPLATTGSVITLNINGIMKLGTGNFSMDTAAAGNPSSWTGGVSRVNIGTSGLLDATLANSTFKTGNALGQFIVVTGNGTLRRTVAASDVLFPIGTSLTSYSPVTINNAGTSDVFNVTLKNTLDNAVPDPTKIVNKQWTITETVAGGSSATIKLGWVTADQAAGFNPANPVVIARWNGSAYEAAAATVTGSGTVADPYIATAAGFTSFSPFIVANASALPVTFSDVKAYLRGKGTQVEWTVATEQDVDKYVIERSITGAEFSAIGSVASKGNTTSLTSYSLFDATPVAGVNFYRVKSVDKDGSFKYSPVLKVKLQIEKAELAIAPNPVTARQMNLQLSGIEKGSYTITLYNSIGQAVYSFKVNVDGSALTQSISLPSSVRGGVYNVQLTGADVRMAKRIVVE
jgi:hypothetical protein